MNRKMSDPGRAAVQLETVYPHAPERVWDALTDPEALKQWLLPGTFRPRLGHRFHFVRRGPTGRRQKVHCEVVELEAPRRLAYTWRTEAEAAPTLVTWTLEPAGAGTRVCLEHVGPGAETNCLLDRSDPFSNCLHGRIGGLPPMGRIMLPLTSRALRCIGRRVRGNDIGPFAASQTEIAGRRKEVASCVR